MNANHNRNYLNKGNNLINDNNINKSKSNQYSKGKITNIKNIPMKKINQKENKYIQNINNNSSNDNLLCEGYFKFDYY